MVMCTVLVNVMRVSWESFPFRNLTLEITKANPWEDQILLFVLSCSLTHFSHLGQQFIPGGGTAVIFDEIIQYGTGVER